VRLFGLERIVDAIRQALIVVDENLRVISANRAFYRAFGVMPAETVGQHLTQVGDQRLNVPALRDFPPPCPNEGAAKTKYEIEIELPGSRQTHVTAESEKIRGTLSQLRDRCGD